MGGATVPQTNLQLYAQLRAAGWPDADLAEVAAGYEWACSLFSARFRPTGKPFVAHLVGTAAVLAEQGARVPVVVAGLVHASYAQGDWGDGEDAWPAPRRRRQLREALGPDVEDLVHRYTHTPARAVAALGASAADLPTIEAEVALMRVADMLDDHVDLGLAHCEGWSGEGLVDGAVEVAAALGATRLADDLRRAADANRDAPAPSSSPRPSGRSAVIRPRSLARRPTTVAWDVVRPVRRRLRRALRR